MKKEFCEVDAKLILNSERKSTKRISERQVESENITTVQKNRSSAQRSPHKKFLIDFDEQTNKSAFQSTTNNNKPDSPKVIQIKLISPIGSDSHSTVAVSNYKKNSLISNFQVKPIAVEFFKRIEQILARLPQREELSLSSDLKSLVYTVLGDIIVPSEEIEVEGLIGKGAFSEVGSCERLGLFGNVLVLPNCHQEGTTGNLRRKTNCNDEPDSDESDQRDLQP